MKINYQKILDEEISAIEKSGTRPTLLLHACCAPCSSAVVEYLSAFFDITLYFYNPNISPESEYTFRLNELRRLLPEMGLENINVVAAEYDNSEFEKVAEGMKDAPEGGIRCAECYRLRLEKSAAYAATHGYDYVTTTLSVSPYKNAELLNGIGAVLGEKYGVKYLTSDFKKRNGYKRSCQLSREYNLYRQNYCGCVYSKPPAEVNG